MYTVPKVLLLQWLLLSALSVCAVSMSKSCRSQHLCNGNARSCSLTVTELMSSGILVVFLAACLKWKVLGGITNVALSWVLAASHASSILPYFVIIACELDHLVSFPMVGASSVFEHRTARLLFVLRYNIVLWMYLTTVSGSKLRALSSFSSMVLLASHSLPHCWGGDSHSSCGEYPTI